METRTSEPLSQSRAASGGKEREGGGGGSGGPRRSGKEEREGRAEARLPRPLLRPPFPDRAASSNRPARARQPRARSPVLSLNALSPPQGSQSPSEPGFLRARARARARLPARPQAPRGPRHVTAPSQGGGGGGASFGCGGSSSGSSCAPAWSGRRVGVERRERQTGTGAPQLRVRPER
ncbi:Intraflagellar Transport Protein 22-like [Manis pentadactyla]|nr:Intraflagellar Transport Protein 22-like [Manis pentadactyla]